MDAPYRSVVAFLKGGEAASAGYDTDLSGLLTTGAAIAGDEPGDDRRRGGVSTTN